jgi:hypothetical protein
MRVFLGFSYPQLAQAFFGQFFSKRMVQALRHECTGALMVVSYCVKQT